jgi:uncharacterized membrane protein
MNGPFGARAKYNDTVALMLIIICAGTLLRIYTLGAENIWYDEASGIHLASGSIKDIIKYTGITQNHPPLYFMLLHLWMRLFGDSEVAVRSLSALFGIASVPLMFYAGRLLFNRKTGLFASFLSSVSVFYIYYSQEARSYSLLLFLSLLSYLFFLKILKGRSKGYIVGYTAATVLLGYTHLFGLLLLPSQWLFMVLYREKYRQCIKQFAFATLLVSVAFVPLVFLIGGPATEIATNGFWIQRPQLMNILKTLYEFTGLQTLSGLLVFVYIVLAMYGLLIIQKRKGEFSLREPLTSLQDMSWNIRLHSVEEGTLLLIWLGVSILIPFVASFLMTPIYFTRYLIGASPAFYLLAACGISAIALCPSYSDRSCVSNRFARILCE